MKFKLVAGREVDLLTKDEARELLHEAHALFRQDHSERTRPAADGATDANGAESIDVYTVPVGMEFRLTRVVVSLDGYSYASQYVNAAGAVEIRRNGQLVDGFNAATGLPNAYAVSGAASPHFKNGETVTIKLVGGPANVNLSVALEGDLYPLRP